MVDSANMSQNRADRSTLIKALVFRPPCPSFGSRMAIRLPKEGHGMRRKLHTSVCTTRLEAVHCDGMR